MESVSATRVMLELQSGQQSITLDPNIKYSYFKIESFSAPHIWNYIPPGVTNFTDSLGVLHILPNLAEQPAVTDLAFLAGAMTSADTGGVTYTFTYSTINMTWTIAAVGLSVFGLDFDNIMAQHLGISNSLGGGRYGFTSVNSVTGVQFFFGTQQIIITTGLQSIGTGTTIMNYTGPLSSPAYQTTPTIMNINLPVKSAIGEIETWYLGDYSPKYKVGQNPMQLTIKVTDEFGMVLDVGQQRMYLTIIYYCVRD